VVRTQAAGDREAFDAPLDACSADDLEEAEIGLDDEQVVGVVGSDCSTWGGSSD
jgi:hypothetical protein